MKFSNILIASNAALLSCIPQEIIYFFDNCCKRIMIWLPLLLFLRMLSKLLIWLHFFHVKERYVIDWIFYYIKDSQIKFLNATCYLIISEKESHCFRTKPFALICVYLKSKDENHKKLFISYVYEFNESSFISLNLWIHYKNNTFN